jgi:hypothetical protein
MATKMEADELFPTLSNGDPAALPSPHDMEFIAKHFGSEDKGADYFTAVYAQRGLDAAAGISLSCTAYYEHLRSFGLTVEEDAAMLAAGFEGYDDELAPPDTVLSNLDAQKQEAVQAEDYTLAHTLQCQIKDHMERAAWATSPSFTCPIKEHENLVKEQQRALEREISSLEEEKARHATLRTTKELL